MFAWIIIIVVIALFQIIGVCKGFPGVYVYISTVLMFLAALGFLYRIYSMKLTLQKRSKDHELIGQILRRTKFASSEQVLDALNQQNEGDIRRLGNILVEMGAITDEQLKKALSMQKKRA